MDIRRYRKNDKIEDLVSRAVSSIDSSNYSESQQEQLEQVIPGMNVEFAEKERYSYFIAEENDKPVGVAGFQNQSGTVSGIFVEPSKMGKGIGTSLLERIEEEARKNGLDILEAPASLDAVEFYRKNGYQSHAREWKTSKEKT